MAGKPAPKKAVASTIPSTKDKDETEDYMMTGESKEDMVAELDDFERRLEGQQPAAKPTSKKASARAIPTNNMPPMVAPKGYKHVKPTSMTEDEEDKMEALRAVSELDKFEQRLGN